MKSVFILFISLLSLSAFEQDNIKHIIDEAYNKDQFNGSLLAAGNSKIVRIV